MCGCIFKYENGPFCFPVKPLNSTPTHSQVATKNKYRILKFINAWDHIELQQCSFLWVCVGAAEKGKEQLGEGAEAVEAAADWLVPLYKGGFMVMSAFLRLLLLHFNQFGSKLNSNGWNETRPKPGTEPRVRLSVGVWVAKEHQPPHETLSWFIVMCLDDLAAAGRGTWRLISVSRSTLIWERYSLLSHLSDTRTVAGPIMLLFSTRVQYSLLPLVLHQPNAINS